MKLRDYFLNGNCQRGANCTFAHGEHEIGTYAGQAQGGGGGGGWGGGAKWQVGTAQPAGQVHKPILIETTGNPELDAELAENAKQIAELEAEMKKTMADVVRGG